MHDYTFLYKSLSVQKLKEMGNLPKIILSVVAVTAIFLWVSTAFNACGSKEISLVDDSEEFVDDMMDESQDFIDAEGDEIFDDVEDTEEFYIEEDDTEVEYVDEPEDTDFTTPPTEVKKAPARPATARPATVNSGSSTGEYMIIAGNYLVESNAGEMTRKLQNLGYNNAEIAVFDYSQYHTVVASRHSSYANALETASSIKRQGVDCYVKKKTY